MDIIKYSIEKNLSVAIHNFNTLVTTETSFEMPKLNDEDWEKISRNIGIISFLQGLPIGGKIYSGYSIVNNNQNEEFVAEESIYIETNDDTYHRIDDANLLTLPNGNIVGAFLNTEYANRTMKYSPPGGGSEILGYYYPRSDLACYNCLVEQTSVSRESNISTILATPEARNNGLARIYYTALGRERYTQFRIEKAF